MIVGAVCGALAIAIFGLYVVQWIVGAWFPDDRLSVARMDLDHFVARACLAGHEGCVCTRPKGHDGWHRCGSNTGLCEPWEDQ